MIAGLVLLASAFAQRPTEGGQFSFDDSDVVMTWDDPSGLVRVHYSVDGPNEARDDDDDEDGVYDFPQEVAATAVEALEVYENLGLRTPITEAEMGLSDLGGSEAFDFYLVDFGGSADGWFGVDACTDAPYHCSGYMVMENDFSGYGYPSISAAIAVLASHELFHAVQAAYDAGQPSWFGEGTAVWAERQFDPDSDDFLWFCDSYLEDSGRSLDRPPTGPVPAFSYGTALWWDFLTTRHDVDLMNELLLATETSDGVPVDTVSEMEGVLQDRGDSLADAWTTFVSWNLATGDRAGVAESYEYAAYLEGISDETEGDALDDDNRFYPLAATYYRLDHAGGPLWFALEEPAPALRFALHAVADGEDDGPVDDALASWSGEDTMIEVAEDAPAGGYWLVGTYPEIASESEKVRFCLGDSSAAEACAPEEEDTDGERPGGCGCSGTPTPPAWLLTVLYAVVLAFRSPHEQPPAGKLSRSARRFGHSDARASSAIG